MVVVDITDMFHASVTVLILHLHHVMHMYTLVYSGQCSVHSNYIPWVLKCYDFHSRFIPMGIFSRGGICLPVT